MKFIHFYIKTIKNRLESYAPATAQKNINVETLKDIVVPLPSVSEQHEIVKMIERSFSIIDSNETVVLNSLQYAQMLRQSILKNAFEGKLVAQDPNDESASVLLEKIKHEKSNAVNKNNSRRTINRSDSKQMRLM